MTALERQRGGSEGGDDMTFLLVEILCFALCREGEKSDYAEARSEVLKPLPSSVFSRRARKSCASGSCRLLEAECDSLMWLSSGSERSRPSLVFFFGFFSSVCAMKVKMIRGI